MGRSSRRAKAPRPVLLSGVEESSRHVAADISLLSMGHDTTGPYGLMKASRRGFIHPTGSICKCYSLHQQKHLTRPVRKSQLQHP